MARASTLLALGSIGAARVALERAAETGNAQATFALSETYDPNALTTARTYGTRGMRQRHATYTRGLMTVVLKRPRIDLTR